MGKRGHAKPRTYPPHRSRQAQSRRRPPLASTSSQLSLPAQIGNQLLEPSNMSKAVTPSPQSGGRRPYTYFLAPPATQIPAETGKFTASGRGKKEAAGISEKGSGDH